MKLQTISHERCVFVDIEDKLKESLLFRRYLD